MSWGFVEGERDSRAITPPDPGGPHWGPVKLWEQRQKVTQPLRGDKSGAKLSGLTCQRPGLGRRDREVQPAFSWERPERAGYGVWGPGKSRARVAGLAVTALVPDVNSTIRGDSGDRGSEGLMHSRKEVDPWPTLLTNQLIL